MKKLFENWRLFTEAEPTGRPPGGFATWEDYWDWWSKGETPNVPAKLQPPVPAPPNVPAKLQPPAVLSPRRRSRTSDWGTEPGLHPVELPSPGRTGRPVPYEVEDLPDPPSDTSGRRRQRQQELEDEIERYEDWQRRQGRDPRHRGPTKLGDHGTRPGPPAASGPTKLGTSEFDKLAQGKPKIVDRVTIRGLDPEFVKKSGIKVGDKIQFAAPRGPGRVRAQVKIIKPDGSYKIYDGAGNLIRKTRALAPDLNLERLKTDPDITDDYNNINRAIRDQQDIDADEESPEQPESEEPKQKKKRSKRRKKRNVIKSLKRIGRKFIGWGLIYAIYEFFDSGFYKILWKAFMDEYEMEDEEAKAAAAGILVFDIITSDMHDQTPEQMARPVLLGDIPDIDREIAHLHATGDYRVSGVLNPLAVLLNFLNLSEYVEQAEAEQEAAAETEAEQETAADRARKERENRAKEKEAREIARRNLEDYPASSGPMPGTPEDPDFGPLPDEDLRENFKRTNRIKKLNIIIS